MNTKVLKNLVLSASVAVLATSCGSTSTDGSAVNGVQKAAGDAAVDAATKNVDPLTGAAVRNATGYGTDPAAGLLKNIGL